MTNRKNTLSAWAAVLVLAATLMLCSPASAVSVEDIVGVWAVSVDLSGVPQLAQLEMEQVDGTLRATLSSEFGSAAINDIMLDADKLQLVYDVDLGHESKAVQLSLEMTDSGLAGWAFTGADDLSMAWPVKAAKLGTGVEAALRSEHSAKQAANTGHTPTLAADRAREFLGVWELTLRRAGIDNSPSFPMWLVVVDVKGKVVVGLSEFNLRGPPRTIYDVAKLPGGLRWTYDTNLFGPLNMDISGSEDELSVQLASPSGEPFLIGTGVRKKSGAEVGVDSELITQEPRVELVGKIGDRARVVEIEDHQVHVQQEKEVTILAVNNPLLVRFQSFRLPEGVRLVSAKGPLACVVEQSMVRLLDVSLPTAPRMIGSCELPGNPPGVVKHRGSLVFAENWNGQADTQQVHIVDISDPASPVQTSHYKTTGGAHDVDVAGSLAYVANRSAGLLVVDVSDPRQPRQCGFFRARGLIHKVAVSGNLAFVEVRSDGEQELAILKYSR